MVFGIFFWFLHNAIILLMERECNVSFFTKKTPARGEKKSRKNQEMKKIRRIRISCFLGREISHSKIGRKVGCRGF